MTDLHEIGAIDKATMQQFSPRGALPSGAVQSSAREQFTEADARMAARMIEQDKLAKQPKRDRLGKFKRK